MGPLDYYRQFTALSEEEVNAGLRSEASRRRTRELERIEPIDLSQTTWPTLPPSDVVSAVTYVARRGLHRYLDPHARQLRSELAAMLGVAPEQVVVGNGAAQLLGAAAQALMEPGDELVTPWPSYPLYPVMARRARARAVPVPGFGADAVLRAINESTRIVVLCNPNDPTGAFLDTKELSRLAGTLPDRVVLLLDEALVDFADAPRDASVALLADHPRLLVFRTLSKAWGLAGLRCGYAIGGPDAEPLLERLEPELGIGELVQAGALEALRVVPKVLERRLELVREARALLVDGLRERGLDVPDTQANVVWIGRDGVDGGELAERLQRVGVLVATGARFGDSSRVRAAVQTPAAAERLLVSVDAALR